MAQLSEERKRAMETPQWHYAVGWSHGKEKFEGAPDLLKGSFYANPVYDEWESVWDKNTGQRGIFKNLWPNEDIPDIEWAFKDLGGFINQVGVKVAKNLDLYIHSWDTTYVPKLERILTNSHRQCGWLLHYFPVDTTDVKELK